MDRVRVETRNRVGVKIMDRARVEVMNRLGFEV